MLVGIRNSNIKCALFLKEGQEVLDGRRKITTFNAFFFFGGIWGSIAWLSDRFYGISTAVIDAHRLQQDVSPSAGQAPCAADKRSPL